MDYRNKKVVVIGLGNSGINSALSLYDEGAIVSVTDSNDNEDIRRNVTLLKEKYIDYEIGKHTREFLEDAELIVVSPGVEKNAIPIMHAEENSIPIISEIELGFSLCKGKIIAITGTNGKSTVVSLVGDMLKVAKMPHVVCGNIGNSLCGELSKIKKNTNVILEVSSFQLERIKTFKPFISVILNIADDHLDRHGDFNEYFDAKKRIYEMQRSGDFTILNYDNPPLRKLGNSGKIESKVLYLSRKEKVEGAYLDKDGLKTFLKNRIKWILKPETNLKGEHNEENILASTLIAVLLGVDKASISKAIKKFKPLAHRFETVALIKGVEFIDDSKATNVDSAYRALTSIKRPVILIAGGKDKHISYDSVIPAVKKKVKKMILIGEASDGMESVFKKIVSVEKAKSLEDAVNIAVKSALKGDVLLLSPMCSSFDMFTNYKERGKVFQKAVKKIKDAQYT